MVSPPKSGAASAHSPPAQTLKLFSSTIVKKLLTGLTGLLLVAFVMAHLLGNLTLFFSAIAYNQLAAILERLGPLTYLFEFVLLAIILVHIGLGINIYRCKCQARPVDYAQYASAGKPSRQTLSSRTMILSGVALGIFLVAHLMTFKYGPMYTTADMPSGETHRDLARLVFETFHQPLPTVSYVVILSILGLHLRHGIWSALQSLGIATRPVVYVMSAVLASAIALGFIGLPLAIYFGLVGS